MAGDSPRSRHRLAFGGTAVLLEGHGPRSTRLLEWLFGHLTEPADAADPPAGRARPAADYLLRDAPGSGSLCLYRGRELLRLGDSDAHTAGVLLSLTCHDLAERARDGIAIHAAAVALAGRGVLLPGRPEAGKTTLAAWLASRGFDYLTDELAFVPDATALVIGLVRPLNVRPASRFAWQAAAPTRSGLVLEGNDFDLVHPSLLGRSPLEPVPLSAVILPQHDPGRPSALRAIGRAEAAFLLLGCITNGAGLPDHGLAALTRLTRCVTTHQLRYRDASEAEALIRPLLP